MKTQKFFSTKLSLTLSFVSLLAFTACDENKFDDITGDDNDKTVTEEKNVNEFNKVKSEDQANVYLHHASDHNAKIKADEDIIDDVKLKVSGSKLVIEVDNDVEFFSDDDATVHVYAPKVKEVTSNGSGDIKCPSKIMNNKMNFVLDGSGYANIWTSNSTDLTIDTEGSGDITVNGPAKNLDLTADGSGDFSASNLNAQKVKAFANGSGDLELTGETNKLDVTLKGSGDLKAVDLKAMKAGISTDGSGDMEVTVVESLKARSFGSGDIEFHGNPTIETMDEDGSGDIEQAS